ncbi:hypothetical protein SBRCBS47491_003358 [Sporothrix bragantina]|uniref:FAD-binding domain-containing protein n=1 Tax=Sporothrix bragantina TaxID=671064 RepID=A0ABP0BEH0_9PEZI
MGRAQDNFDSDWEVTDVLICGCGPTGAMLSSQLGQAGVPNICLDRETGITTDPRGIALDEDGIRALQSVGIYDKIYSDIGKCMGNFNFVGGVHHDLHRPAFTKMDYATTEGGTGHVGFICHKQPALEKHLRNSLLATKSSQLRVQCTLVSITEDDEWVYAQYEDKNKKRRGIKAKFLVGADGKTGYVRKHYLEAKGVRMEHASLTTYEEDWVALNWKITLPTRESHPDFPLWERGYSSEEVYDLFFPQEFRFLCNPERPAVCGRFGLTNDRLWRFEFVVQQGEDGLHMASPEMIKKVVYPYLVHPGSRYGPGQAHHTEILKGWYQERKQQLEASLAATVENGAFTVHRYTVR